MEAECMVRGGITLEYSTFLRVYFVIVITLVNMELSLIGSVWTNMATLRIRRKYNVSITDLCDVAERGYCIISKCANDVL